MCNMQIFMKKKNEKNLHIKNENYLKKPNSIMKNIYNDKSQSRDTFILITCRFEIICE